MTDTWHPQDQLLLIEALVAFARTCTPSRAERAWELATDLADQEGLALDEVSAQVDPYWRGRSPSRSRRRP